MAAYTTINDFIDREITPTLGEFAQDFDTEAIAREVSVYDGHGFVWKSEYKNGGDAYNAVCQKYDMSGN